MATSRTPKRPGRVPGRWLAALLVAGCMGVAGPGWAEAAGPAADAQPFSFDILTDRMRKAAEAPYDMPPPVTVTEDGLDYDDYRMIQFRTPRARQVSDDPRVVLQAYHPGWLFDQSVTLHGVKDGMATPLDFGRDDFFYRGDVAARIGDDAPFPGIAGFRLNTHLNAADRLDEVVSFLGASYFRAVGRGNVYGLSARGLAIDTFNGGDEEFPAFTDFWIQRGTGPGGEIVIFAALDSPSVTGAYRFALRPGDTTVMEVEQRLFFRDDVGQLGIAPLTSMFLFAPSDPGAFRDFRTRVHDSEALLVASDDHTFLRLLANPDRLANSYIGIADPTAFGLVQRTRDFDAYLDSHARYESRPSLLVEPLGDWGSGAVRLIEIPTEFETNDNIVAFWVPQGGIEAGAERTFSYRLHWGDAPPHPEPHIARILRMSSGFGGIAGNAPARDRQKFVIDFDADSLPGPGADSNVVPVVAASDGEIAEILLERLNRHGIWRLVVEFQPGDGPISELSATLMADDIRVSETWLYQWQTK